MGYWISGTSVQVPPPPHCLTGWNLLARNATVMNTWKGLIERPMSSFMGRLGPSRPIATLAFVIACAIPLLGQRQVGELRINAADASGLVVAGATAHISSQEMQMRQEATTDDTGRCVFRNLPYGIYQLQIEHSGFTTETRLVEIRSEVPVTEKFTLRVEPVQTSITVSQQDTLLDPSQTGAVFHTGLQDLQERPAAKPARSIIELVDTEPGWLLEANGVLHPRGSENQVQYVLAGFPMLNNRSPGFAPPLEAEDVQELSVMTGTYPAEYGRKLGGVIEVQTEQAVQAGAHGTAEIEASSSDSLHGYLSGGYAKDRTSGFMSIGAGETDRFLDPPVQQNFTNHAAFGDATVQLQRDFNEHDRVSLAVEHAKTNFLVPNELVQQQACQRQHRSDVETAGRLSYQHVFSASVVGNIRLSASDTSADLSSNSLSTPILASQDRGITQGYGGTSLSADVGRQQIKAGADLVAASIHERFAYQISQPSFFDPDIPAVFQFSGSRRDFEPALFVQDLLRLERWTVSAGLRWDRYHLLVHENAFSPRIGVAYRSPLHNLVLRASYDRVFQTPAVENLLLASSSVAQHLTADTTGLPVRPSRGNFYEIGFSKEIAGHLRLDAGHFWRRVANFSDDDVFLNTGVSFPVAFARAEVQGTEVKIVVPRWGAFSGFASYSNQVGTGFLPVSGGLFIGADAAGKLAARGSFPSTQDQRNTFSSRFRWQAAPKLWTSLGFSYRSGLPVEQVTTSTQDLIRFYGQSVLDQVNFAAGRVRPSYSLDGSVGFELWRREHRSARLQVDGLNLTNHLNVINFASLFSGTALAEPRTVAVRAGISF